MKPPKNWSNFYNFWALPKPSHCLSPITYRLSAILPIASRPSPMPYRLSPIAYCHLPLASWLA